MLDFAIRRLLLIVPTLFGITLIIFTVIGLAPGDPAAARADAVEDPEMSARVAEEIRKRYHLDEPILTRYFMWLGDVFTLDFGKSMSDDLPVIDKIKVAVWPTLKVNICAVVLGFFLSLPIGIYSAARQNGWFDRVSGIVLYMLYSLPSYVGAIVLILYVGVRWDVLPFRNEFSDNYDELSGFGKFMDVVAHMTLYLVCATYASLAYYSRFVRQNLLEVVRQDYIRTARAKGLSERVVILKHAFRNTLIPFITLLGLIVPFLLGGSVILEQIFTWPGLGRLFYSSILNRDIFVVMTLSLATAVLVLFVNLVVDLLYGVVDPRVNHR